MFIFAHKNTGNNCKHREFHMKLSVATLLKAPLIDGPISYVLLIDGFNQRLLFLTDLYPW